MKKNDPLHTLARNITLRTGFLKSTIGTITISGGLGLVISYSSNPGNFDNSVPILGALIAAIGIIIYYAGDWYKISKDKELESMRLEKASSLIDEKIGEEQERLAEEVLLKAELKKKAIDIDVAKQMQDIRDGICQDISEITTNENKLTYCSQHTGNKQLEYVRYPDTFDVSQILEIGMLKLKDREEKINTETLKNYCNDLYDLGLISEKKLNECLIRLNNVDK